MNISVSSGGLLIGCVEEKYWLVGLGGFICAATYERRLGRMSNIVAAKISIEESERHCESGTGEEDKEENHE